MNILASYRYQLSDHKNAIAIFYFVIIVGALVLGGLLSFVVSPTDTGVSVNFGGNEMITLVFLFVVGLCTFKDIFLFSLQNGVSRKSLFAAKLLTIVSVAAIMSAADSILYLLSKGLFLLFGISDYAEAKTMYAGIYGVSDQSAMVLQIKNFFLELVLAMAVMAAGYLITVLFYRLNKSGKIAVSVGIPILFLFVIPFVEMSYSKGAITRELQNLMILLLSTPVRITISSLLAFALFSAVSYLLMRKAAIKK